MTDKNELEVKHLKKSAGINEEFVLCAELIKQTGESEQEYLQREIKTFGGYTKEEQ